MDNSASDYNLTQIFEGLELKPPYQVAQRLQGQLPEPVRFYSKQCSFAELPKDIENVKPGEYRTIEVSGGGLYTTWYYYIRMDGTHTLIWRRALSSCQDIDLVEFRFSGRELSARPWYDPEMQQVHFGDEPPVNGRQYEP